MIKAFFGPSNPNPKPTPRALKNFKNINKDNLTKNIDYIMRNNDAVEGLYYNNPIIIYKASILGNEIIYFKTEHNFLFKSNITLQTIMENKEKYDNLVIYEEEVNKNLLQNNNIINIDGYIRKFTLNNNSIVFNENDKPVVLKEFIVDNGIVYFNIDGGYEDFNNYLPVPKPIPTIYKVKQMVKVKSKSLILPITSIDNSNKNNVRYYLGNNESVFYPAESLELFNETKHFEKAIKTDSVALEKVSHALGINFKEKQKVIFKADKPNPPNMTKPYYIIQSIVGKTKAGFAKTVKLIYEIGEGKTKEKSGNIDVSSLIHYDVLKEGDYVRLPDNNNTVKRKIRKIGKSLFGKTKNEYYLENNETIYKANNLKKVDPPENNTKNNTKDNIKDKARVNKISVGDTVLYDKRQRTVMGINVKKEGSMFSKKDVTYYKLSGINELVKSNQVKKVPREKFDKERSIASPYGRS
jgi:hypothetical protein